MGVLATIEGPPRARGTSVRWILAALALLLASTSEAMVVHCPSGVAVIADTPETSDCAGLCHRWEMRRVEGESALQAFCSETIPSEEEQREAGERSFGVVVGLMLIVGSLATYFLPTFVASRRRHHNANAIFLLNLLLGWTGIGWIAAMIWAVTAVRDED